MICTAPNCGLVRGHGVWHATSKEAMLAGDKWQDFRPSSGKAEIHLTLACDLDCSCCNRASFLQKPHTQSMTLEDLDEFFRQADALNWKPILTLVGGEPTLHPQYTDFVRACVAWAGRQRVQLWSNAYRPRARELMQITRKHGGTVARETVKPQGAIRSKPDGEYWVRDIYVSPADYGMERDPCFQHASVLCGISVDHDGYSPCAMGGTMAAVLGANCRTKRLADLFNPAKVAEMTAEMCKHCGHQWADRPEYGHGIDMDALPRLFDTPMSPTWVKAFEGRK